MDEANKEHKMSEYTYKSWEEYTPLEQAAATWWDMYKDAYNFRPRGVDTSSWTLETFESEMEYLQQVIQRNEAQRLVNEDAAIQDFEERVAKIIALGARDRAMAIRWIHEAEGSDGDDEYLCYCVGVPYGYIRSETAA
jgi:hypothetical protein